MKKQLLIIALGLFTIQAFASANKWPFKSDDSAAETFRKRVELVHGAKCIENKKRNRTPIPFPISFSGSLTKQRFFYNCATTNGTTFKFWVKTLERKGYDENFDAQYDAKIGKTKFKPKSFKVPHKDLNQARDLLRELTGSKTLK